VAELDILKFQNGSKSDEISEFPSSTNTQSAPNATQNPTQYAAVKGGIEQESKGQKIQNSSDLSNDSEPYELLLAAGMGDTGLEPVTSRV
jgi:hypothetical protein